MRVGDFWLDSRLALSPAGIVYSAHEDGGDPVMLILLSRGAAADPAARSRFSGEINAMHIDTVVARGGEGQDEGRTAVRFRPEHDDGPSLKHHAPLAPWAALAHDGSQPAVAEAQRVLHAVDLLRTPPLGTPAGPDFRLPWWERREAGTTRLWPLPWPGRRDRAGWITFLVSWLLMLLIAAVAILLAILVFQNQPLVNPPPPVPTQGSGSGEPTSGSPSGSPSEPSSASPSEASGSPQSPGGDQPSRSDSPSMREPSGDESGPGEPSPNRRL